MVKSSVAKLELGSVMPVRSAIDANANNNLPIICVSLVLFTLKLLTLKIIPAKHIAFT